MNPIHKKWGVLSAARWLWGSCFHLSEQDISLMVLADVEWSTFCSYGTLHQIFKTLEIITQSCYWSWEYERWGTMCFCMTCFPGVGPFPAVLTCVMVHVESVVLQQRCIFSGGHILSFSLLSTLFSTLHPLQLGELQLCTSQDQRLVLLAKSICVAIESLPNLLFSSPGPHTPNTHPYTHAFMSAPCNPHPPPHPSLADSSANPKSEDIEIWNTDTVCPP